jgi:hypothetical protein
MQGEQTLDAISKWSQDKVISWVKDHISKGFTTEIENNFRKNEIDGETLLELTEADMKGLGIIIKYSKILSTAISNLKNGTLSDLN